MPGYNIVAANPTTGALISSTSAENPSDVNDLLMNITRDSIVIVATQNVTQRYRFNISFYYMAFQNSLF
jgi:hypothetical protein